MTARVRLLGLTVSCLLAACASEDDDKPADARPADSGGDRASSDTGTPADTGTAADAAPAPDMAVTPDSPPADSPAADLPPAPDRAPDAPAPDAAADLPVDAPPPDAAPSPDLAADLPPDVPARCGRIYCDCTFNGIKLVGKVQYVDFPDLKTIKVRETPFPDLRVKETIFPTNCGEWQVVTAFPDFKVQKVNAFEDFQIQYSPFPGIPP